MPLADVRRLTEPPDHHFFGYYEKSPWDRPESALLCHAVDFEDRIPRADDAARIRLLDPESGEGRTLGTTTAWNFQQGSMLQWLGPDYQERIVYNDRKDDEFVARIVDRSGNLLRKVSHPIYVPAPDGRTGFSLEFERLFHTRQGYGYEPNGSYDPAPAPDDEGVYRVDLRTGDRERLVSLAELAARDPVDSTDHGLHWVNHVQVAPDGRSLAFIHRWETPGDGRWGDRLYAMNADGTDLRRLCTGLVSHYDWLTATELLAWTREETTAYHRYDLCDGTSSAEPLAPDLLPKDGHISFGPGGRFVLVDLALDDAEGRVLSLYDLETGERHDAIDVPIPPDPDDNRDLRCDLHPRWSPSGREICVDSRHEGTRQVYAVDVHDVALPFDA